MRNIEWKVKAVVLTLLCMCTVLVGSKTASADEKPYSIKVNKTTNVVTVYDSEGEPKKAFVCSTGGATPTGTFNTQQKLRWHVLDGPSYGQYCTRIVRGFLFHSVWYYRNGDKASQSTVQYNRLGTTASHGCVRLTVADAKWIYDNCPVGTSVKIFYGSSKDDPLGKPEAIKVSTASRMGWDPTDPDSANPYLKMAPNITFTKDSYVVDFNTKMDLKEIASARAAYGPYLNKYLMIYVSEPGKSTKTRVEDGDYTFTTIGTYKVTYTVKDPKNGKSKQTTISVKVADTGKPLIKGVMKSKTVEYKKSLNLKKGVKVLTAKGTDLTGSLVVKITKPNKKTFTLKTDSYQFKSLGSYIIEYQAKNSATGKAVSKKIKITVKDTKKPVFSGLKDSNKEYKSTYKTMTKVKAKSSTGSSLTSKITVKVYSPTGSKVKVTNKSFVLSQRGKYKLVYSVTGTNKKKATQTIYVNSVDTGKPALSGVSGTKVVGYKTAYDIRTGITAKTSKNTDLTSNISISIKRPNGKVDQLADKIKKYSFNTVGTYTVTYIATNPDSGKTASKSMTYKVVYYPVISGKTKVSYDLSQGGKTYDVYSGVTIKEKKATSYSMTKFCSVSVSYTPVNKKTPVNVTVSGNSFEIKNAGTYKIVYKVSGKNIVTTSKTRTLTVTDSSEIVYTDLSDGVLYIKGNSINVNDILVARTAADSDLTKYLKVDSVMYVTEDESVEVELNESELVCENAGKYVISYSLDSSISNFYKAANTKHTVEINVVESEEIGLE